MSSSPLEDTILDYVAREQDMRKKQNLLRQIYKDPVLMKRMAAHLEKHEKGWGKL
jgi:hypothetical protein